jgi:hypothetical protein
VEATESLRTGVSLYITPIFIAYCGNINGLSEPFDFLGHRAPVIEEKGRFQSVINPRWFGRYGAPIVESILMWGARVAVRQSGARGQAEEEKEKESRNEGKNDPPPARQPCNVHFGKGGEERLPVRER